MLNTAELSDNGCVVSENFRSGVTISGVATNDVSGPGLWRARHVIMLNLEMSNSSWGFFTSASKPCKVSNPILVPRAITKVAKLHELKRKNAPSLVELHKSPR